MPEHIEHTTEKIVDNLMEAFSGHSPKKSSVFEQGNRVHQMFGGGKSADVFLWRDKKFSSSVLVGATAIWVLFEWLEYHFLFLLCFALVVGMIIQFVWSNASGILNRSNSTVPRLVLPDELFVNIGATVGAEVNRFLGYIQDIACGRDLKKFVIAVAALWSSAILGSWCNFLTVLYIGYVAAHTLPVFYEKYQDQVDNLVYSLLGQLQNQYRKLDEGVLSKIPKGNLTVKKTE